MKALGIYVMAGGFSLGVQQAGFEVIAHLEDGPFGLSTAKLNLPEIADHVHSDPASWPLDEFRGVDFVFGNPPHAEACAATMLNVLERLTPTVWILETWRSPTARDELANSIAARGTQLGYACSVVLMNERDLGATDDRRHCFIALHKVGLTFDMNLQLLAGAVAPYPASWQWRGNSDDQQRLDVSPLAGDWLASAVRKAIDAAEPLPPPGPIAVRDFTEASKARPRPPAAIGTPRRQGPQPGVEYKRMQFRLPPPEEQHALFSDDQVEAWRLLWKQMPQFVKEDLQPLHDIILHFDDAEAFEKFQAGDPEAIEQFRTMVLGYASGSAKPRVTWNTRSLHFPTMPDENRFANKRYVSATGQDCNPIYPVYVISKGRWETRQTAIQLERLNVPYHIVVEPQEADKYRAVIAPEKVLVLPFSNLGQGSIPARNWVWEHAIATGAARHWILDDNIKGFYRMNWNLKTPVGDGSIFRAAEKFVDRFENVVEAGFNYFMFAPARAEQPPLYINTRVYSCILLQNDLPYRWRGRYNEDTDLSIQILKDGHCTLLFNSFLADKSTTMTMKGGNTEALYKLLGEMVPPPMTDANGVVVDRAGKIVLDPNGTPTSSGRLKMAEALRDQHPDIVKVSWKWDRWQHSVDYSRFEKNQLRLKPEFAALPPGVDEPMILEEMIGGQWQRVKIPEAQ